jgi:putative SOS response-associated peptidase YedK
MCGRFVEYSDIEQLKQCFPIDKVLCRIIPNYNVAPTQKNQHDNDIQPKIQGVINADHHERNRS